MNSLIFDRQIRQAVNACLRSLRNEPAITKSMAVGIVASKFPDHRVADEEIVDSVFRRRFER
jgi:uncharacterized protein (DUF2062 family)